MATGHIQPGYGDIVSGLRRAKSAGYPLDREHLLKFAQPDPYVMRQTLGNLKAEAKRVWSAKCNGRTTYDSTYGLPENINQVSPRPPSPRRNNPHPKPVFLVNRLHYVPGYGNPDATLGKPMYRVDACVSPEELERRLEPRRKYVPTIAPAALNPYRDPEGVSQAFLDPRSRAAAEAYLRIADDDRARDGVFNAVTKFEAWQQGESGSRPFSARPSIHRFNKVAGQMELSNLYGMREEDVYKRRAASAFVRPPASLGQARQQELRAYGSFRVDPTRRGEFLIHPDWPPSIPHHRLG